MSTDLQLLDPGSSIIPGLSPGRSRAESSQTFPLTASKARCEHRLRHTTGSGLARGSREKVSQAPNGCLCFWRGTKPSASVSCPDPWTHHSFPGTLLTLGKRSFFSVLSSPEVVSFMFCGFFALYIFAYQAKVIDCVIFMEKMDI